MRAAASSATIATVDKDRAASCLAEAEVKYPILLASGTSNVDDAKANLSWANGILRPVWQT